MKFFAVLSAVLAVAAASPGYWTIPEVSAAIESSGSDSHLIPYLEAALNELMDQAYAGNPSPTTTISTVVQDFSSWTLNELSEAIQDSATDPALLPYLEYGLNTMMSNIMAGETQEYVIIATPVGLLPIEATVPVVTPEAVVVPAETPAAPASPLVQIIVNIKSQEAAVAPVPVIVHDPVSVIEKPVPEIQPVVPSPVVLPPPPYPCPVVVPSPVIVSPPVVPSPVVLPPPVAPEVVMPNPVDIIAVNPVVSVNPVDILHPVPVVVPIGAGNVVGPMV